jgi:flagellar biosynthesis/type III secretory pathway ATPase
VEGDDMNEPIADAVRATLDGHIVLARHLAAVGHYPAIDVLSSVSRLAPQVTDRQQWEAARKLREALATYQQSEDLIQLGAYAAGTNPRLDAAIRARPQLLEFLRQEATGKSAPEETRMRLQALAGQL